MGGITTHGQANTMLEVQCDWPGRQACARIIMEAVTRAVEGHTIAVRLVRLRPDGTPSMETTGLHSTGGSPSMPAEALFGTVHLGEKFASQLVIVNEGAIELHDVRVKVELQTASVRAILSEPEQGTALAVGQNMAIQTLHDIREVGVHIVVCSVHYLNAATNERKFARKFFKFTVINPLALKTKVTEMAERDLILLEAQIQNVSTTTFILETVRFEPIPPLIATTVDVLGDEVLAHLVDGLAISRPTSPRLDRSAEYHERELAPAAMFQFVFCLVHPSVQPSGPLPIGKLDISWRSESGERGRLQTGTLTHVDSQKAAPLSVTVRELPRDGVWVHRPFEALFLLRNGTDRDLSSLQLYYEPIDGDATVPLGCTKVHLGTLTALNTTRHWMTLLPLQRGLVQPSGFYVEYEDAGKVARQQVAFTLFVETGSTTPQYRGNCGAAVITDDEPCK